MYVRWEKTLSGTSAAKVGVSSDCTVGLGRKVQQKNKWAGLGATTCWVAKKKKKISHPTFQCMTYRSRFVCRCVWFLELFFFFTNKRTWQLDGWRVLSFLFLLSVPEQCCNKANRSRNNSCEKTNCQSFYFFPLSPLNLTQRQCVAGQQWLQRVCSLFI